MKTKTRGAVQMILAMTISGTVGWPVLVLGQPPATVVFWRCAFGALAMLATCAALGQLKSGAINRRQLSFAILGGIALVLNWTLLFAAYAHASIAVATVTYHVQPFMLVALGALLFGEKLTANRLGWLLLAFAGMVLIVTGRQNGGGDDYLLGVALALGAALMYAIAAAIVKQLAALPPQLIVLIQLTVGALVMAPFAGLATPPAADRLVAAGDPRPGAYRLDVHAAVRRHSEDPHLSGRRPVVHLPGGGDRGGLGGIRPPPQPVAATGHAGDPGRRGGHELRLATLAGRPAG